MKLLILTQKIDINDDVLGFMHGWVDEFAKQCEKVTVICLYRGKYDLPKNVKVLSLGKEKGVSRLKYIYRFYKYIWQERKNYDSVFVHMNQIYVILGGLFWRLWHKKIGFWYAHGYVPNSLKVAEKFSNIIFTSTKSGFRLESKKKKVVGQGILEIGNPEPRLGGDYFNILTIGRISPVKDYETLINAVEILKTRGYQIKVEIIGPTGLPEQEEYLENLKKILKEKKLEKEIDFIGPVPNRYVSNYHKKADLFVNMSHTGSLDKVVLEAMMSGLPILTCNEALDEVLGDLKDKLIYQKSNFEQFADKIVEIINMNQEERNSLGIKLKEIAKKDHSLKNFVLKIVKEYE